MKKSIIFTALILSTAMSITSLAGQWRQDTKGYWYENDDGSYPTNQWQEIDGKHYYFDLNGYMLHDTTTPDGYQVGNDGAWINTTESLREINLKEFEAYANLLKDTIDNPHKYFRGTVKNNATNTFALTDLNQDGINEIIVLFSNASISSRHIEIWTYDPINDKLMSNGVMGYDNEFFSNGIIKSKASQSQPWGKTIWPYGLYMNVNGHYEMVYDVTCADIEMDKFGDKYSKSKDADNDGVIYFVNNQPMTFMEYQAFVDSTIPDAKKIELKWHSITSIEIERLCVSPTDYISE